MRGLHWFRTDLRLQDNTALHNAINECDVLFAVFIITPKTWLRHDLAACRLELLLSHLATLSAALEKRGIPLLIETTPNFSDCPKLLSKLCKKHKIDTVYFNKQYEVDEMARDDAVQRQLSPDLKVKSFDDKLIMAPGSVINKQGKPFQVFTAFKKAWLQIAGDTQAWHPLPTTRKQFKLEVKPAVIPKSVTGFNNTIDLASWPVGEAKIKQRLLRFCDKGLAQYQQQRDIPAIHGTSQLSPYLALGMISPRQCVNAVMATINATHLFDLTPHQSAASWVSELIWREFYTHILFHFPQVCRGRPFRAYTDDVPWRDDAKQFQAWCEGKTGFPLVDAAMRQLQQTGWMHNRLRMIVAMFLSKLLLIDWRQGEAYFMRHLLDGDFAANNGGWQWSASTGTDAAPYFRIFNPTTQSERFDPDGKFIRQFCPELIRLDNKRIHAPYAYSESPYDVDYPAPIIDYKYMRQYAIETFKKLAK